MSTVTLGELAAMVEDLKGKRIRVIETGYDIYGSVAEVTVDADSMSVAYVCNECPETHRIGGRGNWVRITQPNPQTLRVSVPLIGSATITL